MGTQCPSLCWRGFFLEVDKIKPRPCSEGYRGISGDRVIPGMTAPKQKWLGSQFLCLEPCTSQPPPFFPAPPSLASPSQRLMLSWVRVPSLLLPPCPSPLGTVPVSSRWPCVSLGSVLHKHWGFLDTLTFCPSLPQFPSVPLTVSSPSSSHLLSVVRAGPAEAGP